MFSYKRILIIGSAGSGKSTFSKKLGELTNIPVIHLDKEYWLPNWQTPDKEGWRKRIEELTLVDSWIMDGNYGSTLDLRLKRADLVIFLDYNRFVCVRGVIKRSLNKKEHKRIDLAEGCTEKFDLDFIKWVWSFPKEYRPQIIKSLDEHPNVEKIIFKNRKESKKYLERLKAEKWKKV